MKTFLDMHSIKIFFPMYLCREVIGKLQESEGKRDVLERGEIKEINPAGKLFR